MFNGVHGNVGPCAHLANRSPSLALGKREKVLRHRISTNFQAQAEGMTSEGVIRRLVADIATPEIPKFAR